jgi:anti-sigma B factor antagonist
VRAVDENTITLDKLDDDIPVVVVEGEHDIYTAPTLRERIYALVGDGSGGMVVDLTPATFIDSSVLGVLLGARRRAHEAGQGFAVCCGAETDPGVVRILEATGLIPVLPVVGDRAAAAQTVKDGPSESQ